MHLLSDIRKAAKGQQHVLLATTVYADASIAYTFSLACCRETLRDAGIATSLLIVTGNCYLDDARNTVVREFLASECTELLFLDADVAWRPEQMLTLLQFEDVDIVGGIYPKRLRIDPSMPVNMLPEGGERRPGLIEVAGLPTGFLRIKRHVIETMAADRPTYGPQKTPWLFRLDADENGNRVGEDFRFCNDWRARGGKLWAAADLRLFHVGQDIIQRSLSEALRIQEGSTLRHVASEIQAGRVTLDLINEAAEAAGNHVHVPNGDFLVSCIEFARQAKLPVLELGSGLSTVLMAAAGAKVVALDESSEWAETTDRMAQKAGVDGNVTIWHAPIAGGWYTVPPGLGNDFAFLVVDGPEDVYSRFAFIQALPSIPRVVIFDDMDRPEMAERARQWAAASGRDVAVHSGRLMILK